MVMDFVAMQKGEPMEWIVEAETLSDFIDHGRYTITSKPLIRCKDCKHYQFADSRAFGMPVKMCKWFRFEDVDDGDFCSRAERRTDEQTDRC